MPASSIHTKELIKAKPKVVNSSMISLPVEFQRLNLKKCGASFTLAAFQETILMIEVDKEKNVQFNSTASANLDRGLAEDIDGNVLQLLNSLRLLYV